MYTELFGCRPAQALHFHKGHLLGSDERATPQQIADYILERADENHDNRLSKDEFIAAGVNSPSIRKLVLGTLDATGSPFAHHTPPPGAATATHH